jgi:hypothetical protein
MRQAAFCDAIGRLGTIAAAAQAIGITRQTHYVWLEDPAYKESFRSSRAQFGDRLRHEAIRRAVSGIKTPMMYQGEQVQQPLFDAAGQERVDANGEPLFERLWFTEYSDNLLSMLLRAHCEEFRDKVEITGEGGGPIQIVTVRYPIVMDDPLAWSQRFTPLVLPPASDLEEEEES